MFLKHNQYTFIIRITVIKLVSHVGYLMGKLKEFLNNPPLFRYNLQTMLLINIYNLLMQEQYLTKHYIQIVDKHECPNYRPAHV